MTRPLIETGLSVAHLNIIDAGRPVWHAVSRETILLEPEGIVGPDGMKDRHHGMFRTVRSFESAELKGQTVVNERQVSIGDARDMVEIAKGLALPIGQIEEKSGLSIEDFMARQLAMNVLLTPSGHSLNETVAPGSILAFGENSAHASGLIRVSEYNEPCRQPAAPLLDGLGRLGIDIEMSQPELGAALKEVAADKRGWVGSVWSEAGAISVGQEVFLQEPLLPPSAR